MTGGSALWYLTRGTGVTALLLVTASVVLGIASSVRWAPGRTPRFVVAGLHRNITLLTLAFLGVHIGTTMADGYAPIRVVDLLVPFTSAYRPVWLGLGALALDILLALVVTSLLRARVGLRTWRGLHWLAYAVAPLALLHALGTGSDGRAGWMTLLAVGSMAVVAAAVIWRISVAREPGAPARVGLVAASLAVPLAIGAWALSGPLQTGWAARAGTPASLLHGSGGAPAPPPDLAAGLAAPIAGTLVETGVDGAGEITLRMDGAVTGASPATVRVSLHGPPLDGGGIAMRVSRVTLGPPADPQRFVGQVVALDGRRVVADVRNSAGRALELTLDLSTVDPSGGRMAGRIEAVPVGA